MHEFIRLLQSFARRHLARPERYSELNTGLDGVDMFATPDLGRIEGEFREAARQYRDGEISHERFEAIIKLGGVTHVYANEEVRKTEGQKIWK